MWKRRIHSLSFAPILEIKPHYQLQRQVEAHFIPVYHTGFHAQQRLPTDGCLPSRQSFCLSDKRYAMRQKRYEELLQLTKASIVF